MAILEKEILIEIGNRSKYYEKLGYEIPKIKNKRGNLTVPKGTKIFVKVEDLSKASEYKVTRICDKCGSHKQNVQFKIIIKSREHWEGKDYCRSCISTIQNSRYPDKNHCLIETHPEVAKLLKNKEDGYKVSYGSERKLEFECDKCGHSEFKMVNNVVRSGFACKICSDGISYPEKFVTHMLQQLNIEFKKQKIFSWSKNIIHDNEKLKGNKRYDFYIPSLNCIIETHGSQHYVNTFIRIGEKARSVEEEQENDEIKEKLAKENGIENYIVINCRYSELGWIKNNIVKSELNNLFNISNIDWLKCHEFACNSLIKISCELWNQGNSIEEISNLLNLSSKTTIRKYLKQGSKINWCNYDPEEIRLNSRKIPIVQLTRNGEFIKEWDCASDAIKTLNTSSSLTSVLKGRDKYYTAGGYGWMYKEEYEKCKGKIGKLKSKTPIIQLSMDGKFIREFESIKNASLHTGIKHGNIYSAYRGNSKSAGGFMWLPKERYLIKKDEIKPYTDPHFKKVIQLSKSGEFIKKWDSITNASLELDINFGNISSVCRGRTKTAGGFRWLYEDDYEKQKDSLKPLGRKSTAKKIIQLTMENEFVKEWSSITDASNELKINGISYVCNGKQKYAGGYKWMFKYDYYKDIKIN